MNTRALIVVLAGLMLAILAQNPQAAAQMGLGTVSVQGSQSCGGRDFDGGMTCNAATLSGCSGTDNLQFVYGVENPSGTLNGTIVFFSGDGGDHAADGLDELTLIESYVAAGYQVVQVAWGAGTQGSDGQDWEITNTNGGSNPASILNAACRPASFLNWVRNGNSGTGGGIWGGHGGMCAHGHSAGSGALAYALAWYDAGASSVAWGQGYLDKAVFTSGPVFSDIQRGCEVPNGQSTTICQNSNQLGCVGWGSYTDSYSLEYTTGYKSEVNDWSGNASGVGTPSCANNATPTSAGQNANWLQQSILYNGGTQQPSFSYPKTAISAWLCASVKLGVQVNNAAPEGQLYWAEFTQSSQIKALTVNAIIDCPNTEDVIGSGATIADGSESGFNAILNDMTTLPNRCQARQ